MIGLGKIVINGGRRLNGELEVQGSKNAVLPIIAACILCNDECVIYNCPEISDVYSACEIINYLGGIASLENGTLTVNTKGIYKSDIPKTLMNKMRSSVMFMGAMLGKMGQASLCTPGGCEIGARPVDIHIKALKMLGADVIEEGEILNCRCKKLRGTKVHLEFPSVGATENLMMAATLAKGTTTISNPALEPEIVELQDFINSMGGKIHGAGTKTLVVEGVDTLHGTDFKVRGDRIVASTYLFGAAATGGTIKLDGVKSEDAEAVLTLLKEMGCVVNSTEKSIILSSDGVLKSPKKVITQVFPGFPTDAQAPLTSALAVAEGTTVIHEAIFENRFRHVEELLKMRADIRLDGRVAVVCGVPRLQGALVTARELRGAGALCIAGLIAEGKTVMEGTEYLDRGYVNIECALGMLGADIKREG